MILSCTVELYCNQPNNISLQVVDISCVEWVTKVKHRCLGFLLNIHGVTKTKLIRMLECRSHHSTAMLATGILSIPQYSDFHKTAAKELCSLVQCQENTEYDWYCVLHGIESRKAAILQNNAPTSHAIWDRCFVTTDHSQFIASALLSDIVSSDS